MKAFYKPLKCMLALIAFTTTTNVWAYDPNRIKRPLPLGTSDPLPEGWKFKDIGTITPPSDFCYFEEQKIFYMKAWGNEVSGNSGGDECAFLYFETDEDKQVQVRVMDAEVVAGTSAKGFIMLRGGLENNDPMCMLESIADRVVLCWRMKKGSGSGAGCGQLINPGTNGSTNNPPNCFPRWIKFVRQGLYIQGFQKDDVEGALWKKMDQVKKLELKGKAYMGIGASSILLSGGYGGAKDKPGVFLFDNLEVTEIEIPYEVQDVESVSQSFLEPVKPGKSKDIDITSVFGHALGEYFTIDCNSIDENIAEAYFWERKVDNPTDGEEFRKFVRITGKSEGVTTIRMNCTINGYSMSTDYAINISDGKTKPKTASVTAPFGWELRNLKVAVNPDVVWGEEFVTKRLSLQKMFPIFIGAWEYDWSVYNKDGVVGGGNYGNPNDALEGKTSKNDGPTSNTAHATYIADAKIYNFRDLEREYTKTEGYPEYGKRKEIPSGSSIDLSFYVANDTATEAGKKDFISIDKGSDGQYVWSNAAGFWTEIINYWEPGGKVRGYPYLANVSAGDWVCYTVYAPRAGYYSLYPMAAAKDVSNKPSMQIDINGVMQVRELQLTTKSSNGKDWKKGTSANIQLNEGKNQIRVKFNSGNINFLGLRIAFATASREPYAGVIFNEDKYISTENSINSALMTEDEIDLYNMCLDGTYTEKYPTWDADSVDAFIRTLPLKEEYPLRKVLDTYKSKIKNDLTGYSPEDSVKYVDKFLARNLDTISITTSQQSPNKLFDVTSYMFKKGIDPTKKVEISLKIDSISNAGKGTYMGIMLRSLFFDGNKYDIASNSDFVSFGIGSYEGGRLSYRWKYDYDYNKTDVDGIAQNVYIKLRLNEFAPNYLTAYYSYDNLYWWEYSKDPLKIDFLNSKELNEIAAGIYLTGGNFANEATLALAKVRDLDIKELEENTPFEDLNNVQDLFNSSLKLSNTNINAGEEVNASFNVTKPGLVTLKVYDSFGVMVQSIFENKYMEYSKEDVNTPIKFNLKQSGIYLLRLEAPNNEQYIRFRYTSK